VLPCFSITTTNFAGPDFILRSQAGGLFKKMPPILRLTACPDLLVYSMSTKKMISLTGIAQRKFPILRKLALQP
jgi:hypothetical protein